MLNGKNKLKLTDFECNFLINEMNKFCNMLLSEGILIEDVNELLLKIINKFERWWGDNMYDFIQEFYYGNLDPQARSTKGNKTA